MLRTDAATCPSMLYTTIIAARFPKYDGVSHLSQPVRLEYLQIIGKMSDVVASAYRHSSQDGRRMRSCPNVIFNVIHPQSKGIRKI